MFNSSQTQNENSNFMRSCHLAAENKELRERNMKLQENKRLMEIELQKANRDNEINDTLLKNWYNTRHKITDEMNATTKTFWFRKYTEQINDLKNKQAIMTQKLKVSILIIHDL